MLICGVYKISWVQTPITNGNLKSKNFPWGRYKTERDQLRQQRRRLKGPLQGDKKFPGSEKTDYQWQKEVKECFFGYNIKQKETQLGTHKGHLESQPPGDKTF